MSLQVMRADDPEEVWQRARAFLAGEPWFHHLISTLLCTRARHPQPGRYWVASRDGQVAGVVLQSPLDLPANLSLMDVDVVDAMVDAIAGDAVDLPGVNGDAATAARFAGRWTERLNVGAVPADGQRIYEVREVRPWRPVAGRLRQAGASDRELLTAWTRGFHADIDERGGDAARVVDERLPEGVFSIWDDAQPMSMLCRSPSVSGVVRVQIVYTPPSLRRRGYGSACVGQASADTLRAGDRCILYTDLANAKVNSLYRSLGYRAIAECLRYRFVTD